MNILAFVLFCVFCFPLPGHFHSNGNDAGRLLLSSSRKVNTLQGGEPGVQQSCLICRTGGNLGEVVCADKRFQLSKSDICCLGATRIIRERHGRKIRDQKFARGHAVESFELAREVGRLLVTEADRDFFHALPAREQLEGLLLSQTIQPLLRGFARGFRKKPLELPERNTAPFRQLLRVVAGLLGQSLPVADTAQATPHATKKAARG